MLVQSKDWRDTTTWIFDGLGLGLISTLSLCNIHFQSSPLSVSLAGGHLEDHIISQSKWRCGVKRYRSQYISHYWVGLARPGLPGYLSGSVWLTLIQHMSRQYVNMSLLYTDHSLKLAVWQCNASPSWSIRIHRPSHLVRIQDSYSLVSQDVRISSYSTPCTAHVVCTVMSRKKNIFFSF